MKALGALVAPLSAGEFLEGWWQQRPWVGPPRPLAGDLPGFEEIDSLLASGTVRTPRLRLLAGQTEIPASAYTRGLRLGENEVEGLPDMPALLGKLEGGACLELGHLERVCEPVGLMCAGLARELYAPVAAGALLDLGTAREPPGNLWQETASDTVLVQLAGETWWRLAEGPEGKEANVRLAEGARLYLPGRTRHRRLPGRAPQLCLRLEARPATWLRLFGRLTRCAVRGLETDPELRRAAGEGWSAGQEALVDRLFSHGGWEAGRQMLLEDFFRAQAPRRSGALVACLASGPLDPETRLRRRPEVLCLYLREGDRVQITFDNKDLQFPLAYDDVLRRLVQTQPYRLADLDHPGGEGPALASRLLREGLLETVA